LPIALSLVFIYAGAWPIAVPFIFVLGGFLGIPFCIRYAEHLDDLKAVLWTPQKPGRRKIERPAYPKQERMQSEEMPMAYYEEMSQRY